MPRERLPVIHAAAPCSEHRNGVPDLHVKFDLQRVSQKLWSILGNTITDGDVVTVTATGWVEARVRRCAGPRRGRPDAPHALTRVETRARSGHPRSPRGIMPSMPAFTKITWHLNTEDRHPFGPVSPDPARYDPIGFPPPWPDRPWVYGVMVASVNGVVAWQRRDSSDDPVRAILGGDDTRPERIADRQLMRLLRCYGDVSIGAQTLRDQPYLVQTPQEPGEEPVPELYRFRTDHKLPYHPRTIVYSLLGRLPLDNAVFHTAGLEVIVITSERGVDELSRRGDTGLTKIVEAVPGAEALQRAHRRLFAEHGVRYLACEGGETLLRALHAAGLLDEVFLTTTDAIVDRSAHPGVLTILDFEREGGVLIAEGRTRPQSGWLFRRWRLNDR